MPLACRCEDCGMTLMMNFTCSDCCTIFRGRLNSRGPSRPCAVSLPEADERGLGCAVLGNQISMIIDFLRLTLRPHQTDSILSLGGLSWP